MSGKPLVSLFLSGLLLLSLTACGPKESPAPEASSAPVDVSARAPA